MDRRSRLVEGGKSFQDNRRVPQQELVDYFRSQSEMAKFVLDQQTHIVQHTPEWGNLSSSERDRKLDSAFQIPLAIAYEREQWGRSLVYHVFSVACVATFLV